MANLFSKKQRNCVKLINYQKRQLQFSSDVGGGTFALNNFSTEVKRIEEASEVAKALDDYQYHMCKLHQNFKDDDPKFKEYLQDQKNVLKIITALRLTLSAFERDPENQTQSLSRIIQTMQKLLGMMDLMEEENKSLEENGIDAELKLDTKVRIPKTRIAEHEARIKKIEQLRYELENSEDGISLSDEKKLKIGNYYYHTNNKEKAAKVYDEILQKNPNNEIAQKNKKTVSDQVNKIFEKEERWRNKNVDLNLLARLVEEFFERDNFKKVETVKDPDSKHIHIQARKGGTLRALAASKKAVHISIKGSPNDFTVSMAMGEWVNNMVMMTATAAVTAVFTGGLSLLGQGAGLILNARFRQKLWDFITDAINSTSKLPVDTDDESVFSSYAQSRPHPPKPETPHDSKTDSSDSFSSHIKESQTTENLNDDTIQGQDTKFCVYCGTKIPTNAMFCSKCGKTQS